MLTPWKTVFLEFAHFRRDDELALALGFTPETVPAIWKPRPSLGFTGLPNSGLKRVAEDHRLSRVLEVSQQGLRAMMSTQYTRRPPI